MQAISNMLDLEFLTSEWCKSNVYSIEISDFVFDLFLD